MNNICYTVCKCNAYRYSDKNKKTKQTTSALNVYALLCAIDQVVDFQSQYFQLVFDVVSIDLTLSINKVYENTNMVK